MLTRCMQRVVLALSCCGLMAAGFVNAQPYPAKPIRIVVPYPTGGGNDTFARLFGQQLSDRLGQSVIVDNRPGAGTTIGATLVAKSPPDGYTLLLGSSATHAIAPALYAKVDYDPIADFIPITELAYSPTVAVVNPSVPAQTLAEFIALAKSKPGAIAYASGGSGTPTHIAGEVFKKAAGVDLLHVPYKGGGPALADLMGGQVQVIFDSAASAMPHVKSGRLKALAIAFPKRHPEYPDLPTFTEAGLPGYEVNSWYGLFAPAGTSPEIVGKLHKELVSILGTEEVKGRLKQLVAEPVGSSPEVFRKRVGEEVSKYRDIIKDANLKVE